MISKKTLLIICALVILILTINTTTATENNITGDTYEQNTQIEKTQQIVVNNTEKQQKINKINQSQTKTSTKNTTYESLTLNVTVKNKTIKLESDAGHESAITRNITTTNGKPDVTKLGKDYAYADENGTYTIEGNEIRRVMKLDSLTQQIYGFTPKYTFFRSIGSNTKYVISREKWNVIARTLNGYHVNQGYNAVNTPYAITVNLTGKTRYYNIYYDAQEWINGHQYTCGPTAMSMISQALNCYSSEKRLAGIYSTTASDGTSESSIIRNSPTANMKLVNIANTQTAVKTSLQKGNMIFWHIKGHYMCIVGYNKKTNKYLCLNPSGPSHNINAVQWATWTEIKNTDRPLKDNGFMIVKPCHKITQTDKKHIKYYYYNMGGRYTIPINNEYPDTGYDNNIKIIKNTPKNTIKTTNQTQLKISSEIKGLNTKINNGKIAIYLNTKAIKVLNVQKGIINYNYTLPAYTQDNITITAKYIDANNKTITKTKTIFNKNNISQKYTNTTRIAGYESITLEKITGKKGDQVTFKAIITDTKGKLVNTGSVVFKINGNTIKQNGTIIKVKPVNGVAKLDYVIPAYTAKTYKITAVYTNNKNVLETNSTLTIQKLKTKINDINLTQNNHTTMLTANAVDECGSNLEKDIKVSVKVDGKTLIKQARIKDGLINLTLNLTNYRKGNHTLTIVSGETGLYSSVSVNKTFVKQ